jgi:multidrug transporter EmrE-like cation transporter
MTSYLYILGTISFTVYGQLILKWRISKLEFNLPEGIFLKIISLFKLVFDPYIFSGFASAFIASFFWMAAISKLDLSHAYPIVVGGLAIITSIFAIILFKESFNLYKIIGIILIVLGVYFLGKGV